MTNQEIQNEIEKLEKEIQELRDTHKNDVWENMEYAILIGCKFGQIRILKYQLQDG